MCPCISSFGRTASHTSTIRSLDAFDSASVSSEKPMALNLKTLCTAFTGVPAGDSWVNIQGTTARELIVEHVPAGWEHPALCKIASSLVTSAIDSQPEAWTASPLNDNAASHWTVLT